MKTLYLSIIIAGICAVIVTGLALSTIFINRSVGLESSNIQLINQTNNCPRNNGFTMNVGDTYVDGVLVTGHVGSLIITGGENATYKIKIKSEASNSIPLSFKVFNDNGNYRDLAFARVKFTGDIAGLPKGLIASLDKNTTTLRPGGNDEITLILTTNQNMTSETLQMGVLGDVKTDSTDGCTQGYGDILNIPITVK